MISVFKEAKYNEELERNGFVIRPLLSESEVQQCRAVYKKYFPETEMKKYNTLEINDHHYRLNVSNDLREILERRVFEQTEEYRFVGVNFAVKQAKSHEEFEMHIDDDHCDRSRYLGLNVWVPLCDVHKDNGGLYVVPGSQHLPPTINGIGSSFPYQAIRDMLLAEANFVNMKAGEALYFDDRIVHGSLTNPTDNDRLAMVLGMIPKAAQFIMYINHDEIEAHQLELFEVDNDILHKLIIGKRPVGYKSLGIVDQVQMELTENELRNFLESTVSSGLN